MSTVDDVYARMDDLVPPTAIEIEDAFLGAVFERDRLAARLAEVEGKLETAEGEAYYWRSLCSEDDRVEQLQRRLAEVEAENARLRELALVEAEGQHDEMLGATALAAERDRLAQELEDANAKLAIAESVEVEDKSGVELLFEMGHPSFRSAWREACDWRDQFRMERDEALGHLRAVLDAWDPMAENYEMGPFFEAREFLARFPVKEGDGNG